MSIIDTAKKLLKKGIALKDAELVEMANLLLSQEEGSGGDIEKPTHDEKPTDKFSEFVMDKSEYSSKYVPVNSITDRVNQFVDDKTEHTDVTTPDVPLTHRERPSHETVEQLCEACNKQFSVVEAHARDNFLCDRCILDRR